MGMKQQVTDFQIRRELQNIIDSLWRRVSATALDPEKLIFGRCKLRMKVEREHSIRGNVFIEFALVLTLCITPLAIAIIELGSLMRDYLIVNSLSREGGNLVARGTRADPAIRILAEAANPLEILGENGRIIISTITGHGTSPPTVTGQISRGGSSDTSRVGSTGNPADVPESLSTLPDRKIVIIVEVFWHHHSIVNRTLGFLRIPEEYPLYNMAIFSAS